MGTRMKSPSEQGYGSLLFTAQSLTSIYSSMLPALKHLEPVFPGKVPLDRWRIKSVFHLSWVSFQNGNLEDLSPSSFPAILQSWDITKPICSLTPGKWPQVPTSGIAKLQLLQLSYVPLYFLFHILSLFHTASFHHHCHFPYKSATFKIRQITNIIIFIISVLLNDYVFHLLSIHYLLFSYCYYSK